MNVTICRICKNSNLIPIFSLGDQPLANNFLRSPDEKVEVYPLALVQCSHCHLIQLSFVVSKEQLFDTYFYIPSVSKTYLAHFREMSRLLIKKLSLKKNAFVLDIGGSDGSLLEVFQQQGMKVLNVEPAKNIVSKVLKVNKYFNKKTARYIVNKFGKAKLVTATNVFAHINDLDEFIGGLDILLDKDGVFFAQFPDVKHLLRENQFDTIYHEHLSYFTHEPLQHLFMGTPFEIFEMENSTIHGGSMRIYVRRRDNLLEDFVKNVPQIKKELTEYIDKQYAKGKKIVAFGAAAKGMVLLYYCGLDNKKIAYVADGTLYKQGKFTPGTNIPVKPESELLKNPPDVILILAWNFKEEIIKKVKKMFVGKKKKISFVVPIPGVQIIQ